MKRKSIIAIILIAVFILSAVSVMAIANYQTTLKSNYVQSIKCKAQGDIMPKALTDELLAPSDNNDTIFMQVFTEIIVRGL